MPTDQWRGQDKSTTQSLGHEPEKNSRCHVSPSPYIPAGNWTNRPKLFRESILDPFSAPVTLQVKIDLRIDSKWMPPQGRGEGGY